MVQALIGAVTPVIVYFISREFFRERVSLTAAAITAVYPSYVVFSGRIFSENLFILLLALLILFTLRLWRNFSYLNAALVGILLGCCSLTRGVTVPLMVIAPLLAVEQQAQAQAAYS